MTTPESSPTGSLEERVAARQDSLSAAERRVARYLADHPDEVAFSSAGTLGQLTETSDATVIRTVKSLGYAGLPALKRALQDGLRERLTPAGRLEHSLDAIGSDPKAILGMVLGESIQLLEEASRMVRADNFTDAVELIGGARETLVLSVGWLGLLGSYFALRLNRMRHHARSSMASGFMLADDLLRLREDDVLVLLAHQTVVTEINVALDHAAKVGTKIVLITDTLGEALNGRVTTTISAPIGGSAAYSVQATTVAVLDALVLAVAAADRESAVDAMTEMNDLRDRLRNPSDVPAEGRLKARRSASRNGSR
jgi:DNA-binding MurR/RpiR family transcriptional regulator